LCREISDRQQHDVLGVLQAQAQQLDRGYQRHTAPELGVRDLSERAFREAALWPHG